MAAGTWYTDAVNWAADNNIVGGYGNGKFGTNDNLTRQDLATILYRYAQYKGYDVSGQNDLAAFTDAASVSSYAQSAVKWAVDAGIISGVKADVLSPKTDTSRAQVATMLMRFAENVK